VIVAEVFGSGLLTEGALQTFHHAATQLAREGAQIIPAKATIRVALAHYEFEKEDLANVQGFDLSHFERHIKPDHLVPIGSPTLHLRSDPADLFSFDFQAGREAHNERRELSLSCRGGTANGVVRWIQLTLDDLETYENIPQHGRDSHRSAVFTPMPRGEVADQTLVSVGAAHNMEHVYTWFP
jgi:hypothetical protein